MVNTEQMVTDEIAVIKAPEISCYKSTPWSKSACYFNLKVYHDIGNGDKERYFNTWKLPL